MEDQDYADLRTRLMAHQALLCVALAAHPDKVRLSGFVVEAINQMKSLLLASRLDDKVVDIFDQEVQSILKKAGLEAEGY